MKKLFFWFPFIASLALLIFFFRLGAMPLLDPDEPRYAQAAREMKDSGDTINPQLNGENRWDKPVFFYWLILASYKLYGVSEWAARFPSALFSLLMILLCYLWSIRCGGRLWGLWASLILMTNLEFCIIGRLAITDMTLSFFQSLAIIFAFEAWRVNRPQYLFFCFVASGVAFLTKGPVGILLPGMVFFLFLVLSKNLKFLKQVQWITSLMAFLAIALPWYAVECFLYPDFFEYFFILHNVKRFATDELRHSEPLYYYVAVIAIGFFPWSIFVPRALTKAFKNLWKEPINLYLSIWFLTGFLFFSISRAKLPTYILSIFLPLSLLVARFLEEVLENSSKIKLKIEGLVLSIASIGILIGGSVFWYIKFPNNGLAFFCAVIASFAGFFASAIFLLKEKFSIAFKAMVVSFIIGFLSVHSFLTEDIGQTRSMKKLVLSQPLQNQPAYSVVSFRFLKPSLIFYLGYPIKKINSLKELESFMKSPFQRYCVMREEDFLELQIQSLYPNLFLLQHILGKVVISNSREPRDIPLKNSRISV